MEPESNDIDTSVCAESIALYECEQSVRDRDIRNLKNALLPYHMDIFRNVPYDGDCYFSSITSLLPGYGYTASSLRRSLHQYVTSNVQNHSVNQ